jgi:hypothetical protein
MPDNQPHPIENPKGGLIPDLVLRAKLIMRLMGDSRVNPLIKLLPLGSLIYFIIPDIAPGPIDDAAILWLGTYLFVELCPPHVVQEHLADLNSVLPGQWADPLSPDDEVVDGTFTEEPGRPSR